MDAFMLDVEAQNRKLADLNEAANLYSREAKAWWKRFTYDRVTYSNIFVHEENEEFIRGILNAATYTDVVLMLHRLQQYYTVILAKDWDIIGASVRYRGGAELYFGITYDADSGFSFNS